MAKGADEAEILATTVLRSLQQARGDFLANGYIYFSIESIDELNPQEQLAAEELGVFVRRLSISAQIQEDVARLFEDPTLGTLSLGLAPSGKVTFMS